MEHKNVVVEKSLDFSVELIKFCELLEKQRKFILANQLLKSGTSIGANIFEAQHAESRSDFIHKMKIAVKEANETLYWLVICERSESYPNSSSLKPLAEELIRIISKIILSSKGKRIGGILTLLIAAFSLLVSDLKWMLT
ncbi:MAG TPA: four helix bundle protein [Agriterribacter sp.]|nr:four helix bundle protein [Chitinophagaceae bacterium]HRP33489.1 four helix bundle protein [Agriterribacter sp.]